jgi:Uma2 family endonuclease
MATQPLPYVTEEEYLAQERDEWWVGDYYQGKIYPAEATTYQHSLIASNLLGVLATRALGRDCTVHGMGLMVQVKSTGLYVHPDITILCGPPQFSDVRKSAIVNPTAIIEIASPSGKFKHYRKLPSLKEYITVEQEAPEVTRHLRQSDRAWLDEDFEGLANTLYVKTLDLEIPFSAIYEGVEFS